MFESRVFHFKVIPKWACLEIVVPFGFPFNPNRKNDKTFCFVEATLSWGVGLKNQADISHMRQTQAQL